MRRPSTSVNATYFRLYTNVAQDRPVISGT